MTKLLHITCLNSDDTGMKTQYIILNIRIRTEQNTATYQWDVEFAYMGTATTGGRTLQVRVILLPHSTTNFTKYFCCAVLVASHTSFITWWHISDRHLFQFLQQPWGTYITRFCLHHQYSLWPRIKECTTCLLVVSFRYIKSTVVHCKLKPNIKMIQPRIMF